MICVDVIIILAIGQSHSFENLLFVRNTHNLSDAPEQEAKVRSSFRSVKRKLCLFKRLRRLCDYKTI